MRVKMRIGGKADGRPFWVAFDRAGDSVNYAHGMSSLGEAREHGRKYSESARSQTVGVYTGTNDLYSVYRNGKEIPFTSKRLQVYRC